MKKEDLGITVTKTIKVKIDIFKLEYVVNELLNEFESLRDFEDSLITKDGVDFYLLENLFEKVLYRETICQIYSIDKFLNGDATCYAYATNYAIEYFGKIYIISWGI